MKMRPAAEDVKTARQAAMVRERAWSARLERLEEMVGAPNVRPASSWTS
jgi:hypothetical protein